MRQILLGPVAGILYILVSFLLVKDYIVGEPHTLMSALGFLICFSSFSAIIFLLVAHAIVYKSVSNNFLGLGFLTLILFINGLITIISTCVVALGAPAKQITVLACMTINIILGVFMAILDARFNRAKK